MERGANFVNTIMNYKKKKKYTNFLSRVYFCIPFVKCNELYEINLHM